MGWEVGGVSFDLACSFLSGNEHKLSIIYPFLFCVQGILCSVRTIQLRFGVGIFTCVFS